MKINIFHILEEIIIFLLIIYSFTEFKVLIIVPKSFHGPLDNENALRLTH